MQWDRLPDVRGRRKVRALIVTTNVMYRASLICIPVSAIRMCAQRHCFFFIYTLPVRVFKVHLDAITFAQYHLKSPRTSKQLKRVRESEQENNAEPHNLQALSISGNLKHKSYHGACFGLIPVFPLLFVYCLEKGLYFFVSPVEWDLKLICVCDRARELRLKTWPSQL